MQIKHIALLVAMVSGSAANAQSALDGFYAGASFATFSGDNTYNDVDFPLEGQMLGAFAGYNMQSGAYVFGGEVSFMVGAANEEDFDDEYEYSSIIDFKGRVGYDSGNIMPYVVIGASSGTFVIDDDTAPDRDFDQTELGTLFGLGLDYAINDQFGLGAEIVTRNFEFEFPVAANLADLDATVNSLSLRASYNF